MVEEPAQAVKWNFLVYRLEDIKETADRLVVRRVQTEGPAVLSEQPHHLRQLLLQGHDEVGPRFEKILEVGRREDEHLPGAVHAIVIISLARLCHRHPFRKIVK